LHPPRLVLLQEPVDHAAHAAANAANAAANAANARANAANAAANAANAAANAANAAANLQPHDLTSKKKVQGFVDLKHSEKDWPKLAADWFSEHSGYVLHVNHSAASFVHKSWEGTLDWELEAGSALFGGRRMNTIALGTVAIGCVIVVAVVAMTLRSVDADITESEIADSLSQLKSAVIVASLNHFCMGYNAGIIAGAMLHIEHDTDFAPMDSRSQGTLVSCLLAGATFGAACCFLSDLYGRRHTLQMVSVIFIVGPVIMFAAPSFWILVLGRFVTGWSVGMTSGLVNVYISEIAPACHRGKLGGWAPFCGTCGIIVAYMTSVLLGLLPHGAWRYQLGLAMVPALCFLFFQDHIQETPRWLLAQGRHADAHTSVTRLYPKRQDSEIQQWLQGISQENALVDMGHKDGYWTLISTHRRSFLVGTAINVLQQLSGVNIVIYFGPTILKSAGFSTSGAMISTLFVSLAQLSATSALIGWVDHVGRRSMALLGTSLMVFGHALLVVGFSMTAASGLAWSSFAWVAVAGMLLFRTAFSLSLGPLPYIMTTELFPQQVRAVGVAWSWTCNWGSNFLIAFVFPPLVDILTQHVGHKLAMAAIFAMFGIFSALTVIFVLVALPETTGLSLEVASCHEVLLRKRSFDKEDSSSSMY